MFFLLLLLSEQVGQLAHGDNVLFLCVSLLVGKKRGSLRGLSACWGAEDTVGSVLWEDEESVALTDGDAWKTRHRSSNHDHICGLLMRVL